MGRSIFRKIYRGGKDAIKFFDTVGNFDNYLETISVDIQKF